MNDYKELIDTLKRLSNKPETYQALFYTAAVAIEKLVKERDAAIADIEHSCEKCKWETISGKCSHPTYCVWEWRGVQE